MLLQKEETIRALEAKKIEQDEELVQLRAELQYEKLARQDLEKVRIEMAGRQSVADAEKQAADSKIEQLKRKCLQSESMQKALQQAVDAETAALEADRAKFVALACELEQERRKLQQELATAAEAPPRFSPVVHNSRLSTGSNLSDGGYLSDRSSIGGGRGASPDSDGGGGGGGGVNSSMLLNSSLLNTSRTSKRGGSSALQKAKEKRIEEARKKQDKQIKELQSQVASLQRKLAAEDGSAAPTPVPPLDAPASAEVVDELEARLGELARDLKLSKQTSADLESKNESLAKQLAAVNDAAVTNTAGVEKGKYKVQHMKENPVAWAMKARAAAAAACTCNIGGGAASGAGAGGASAAAMAEMKEVVEKLTAERDTARKGGERLKQVFKEFTDAYKGIVYRLTGYHIDQFAAEGEGKKFRVQSMYAEQQDDYLIFEEGVDGAVSILDNEFAQQHGETIAGYMGQLQSFPGLLGQLTLDLLENTTCA